MKHHNERSSEENGYFSSKNLQIPTFICAVVDRVYVSLLLLAESAEVFVFETLHV